MNRCLSLLRTRGAFSLHVLHSWLGFMSHGLLIWELLSFPHTPPPFSFCFSLRNSVNVKLFKNKKRQDSGFPSFSCNQQYQNFLSFLVFRLSHEMKNCKDDNLMSVQLYTYTWLCQLYFYTHKCQKITSFVFLIEFESSFYH